MSRFSKLFIVTLVSIFAVSALAGPPDHARFRTAERGIPDQYIVVLNDGETDVRGAANEMAATHAAVLGHVYGSALKGFSARMSEGMAKRLSNDPRVAWVEQDAIIQLEATQTNATWGLDRVDQRQRPLDGTYTYETDAAGVRAYILDTGILYGHQDFGGRASFGFDAFGGNGSDCNGHGTHVSGTVGGTVYGVAKKVTLIAVRVLDCSGSGTTAGVIAGIDWVTANHVKPAVANMSLGGGASSTLDAAVQNSIKEGVGYAVAAGNGNIAGRAQDACNYSPARVPEAMTVGATTSSDAKASYSNYGNCVDFFAPGSSITSAWHTSNTATNTISGTSMAAPHVAGAAALYLKGSPGASPQQVRDALYANTTKGIVTSSNTTNNHLLYTMGLSGGGGGEPPPPNSPPTANFTYTTSGLTVNFTDTSTDSDGSISSRSWNFGDGGTSTATNPSRTYASGGTYTVTLTVTDNGGATDTTSQSVTVTAPPPGEGISLSVTGYKIRGQRYADLVWSGATSTNVDVYRNGVVVATVTNNGAYTNGPFGNGGGTFTFRVCEAGTSACSNDVSVAY